MNKQMKLVSKIGSLFLGLGIATILSGCGSSATDDSDSLSIETAETVKEDNTQLSTEVVTDIIKSIPSPLEMAALIKASGADYNESILNSTENQEKYATTFQKGLGLGIYGADLGYINLYEKTGSTISYLNAIRDIADELKVGQFFDFTTIKRLATNNTNLDSIIYISTSGFEKMNTYLKDKNRGNVSMLILVGGWLEALYISTEVAAISESSNKALVERIGEQKIVLDDLLLLLSVYSKDAAIQTIIADLEDIKTTYDKVKITYEYAEPETKEVDGMLVIVDNSKSVVNITPEVLEEITGKVKALRQKLI